MDLQRLLNDIKAQIEERDKVVVAQLRNNVPHDLAGANVLLHLQGYAKAIGDVKTIMEDIYDEYRKRDQEEEPGTEGSDDTDEND